MIKHGHRTVAKTSPTWISWRAMRERCLNKRASDYARYGGRGITITPRWSSFLLFLEDMGERPKGKTLDRKNVNLGYYKENCRWLLEKDQNSNTRRNRFITFRGRTQILKAWAEEMKLSHTTIVMRLRKGWSVKDALTKPAMTRAVRGILGLRATGLL